MEETPRTPTIVNITINGDININLNSRNETPSTSIPIPIPPIFPTTTTGTTDPIRNVLNSLFSDNISIDIQTESLNQPSNNNQGLTDDEFNNNTTTYIYQGNTNDNNTCIICSASYEAESSLTKINRCNHIFHTECIKRWFDNNPSCPICRTNVIS